MTSAFTPLNGWIRYVRHAPARLPAALLVTTIACSQPPAGDHAHPGHAASPPDRQAIPVGIARVERRSVPLTAGAVGTVTPLATVEIRSQITGQVIDIHFREGEDVVAGQLLFSLDPRPLEAGVAQARAVLERDMAQAANADAEFKRNQDLMNRGLVPREQYEMAETAAASLHATVGADDAAVQNAQLQLQYTSIHAPIAGRTGALNVHTGDLVRATDTAPLVVLNQLAPITVAFAVPAALLPDVRRYQTMHPLRVDATVPDASPGDATGELTFIDNTVDPSTNTIKLKATFPNRDRLLWPGSFVDVTLRLADQPNALVVPPAAVQSGQQGPYVFVVGRDDTVAVAPVKVDRTTAAAAVIASGVTEGQTVVTDGQLRLSPGSRVRPASPADEPGTAEATR